jgi:hypothetical protein
VGVFGPLKKSIWNEVLEWWRRQTRHKGLLALDKVVFPVLLKRAFDKLKDKQQWAVSGWERSGLYPINMSKPMKKVLALPEEGEVDTPKKAMRTVGADILSLPIAPEVQEVLSNREKIYVNLTTSTDLAALNFRNF